MSTARTAALRLAPVLLILLATSCISRETEVDQSRGDRQVHEILKEAALGRALLDEGDLEGIAIEAPRGADQLFQLPSGGGKPALLERSQQPLGLGKSAARLTLADVLVRSAAASPQVKTFSQLPLIRDTAVDESVGEYDPRLFAEARFNRLSEPVGSTLKTARRERLEENEATGRFGVRKKFSPGTRVELAQELGHLDNNSEFTVPNPQAQSRLALRVEQPLLQGAGMRYNKAAIVIAKLDTQIAEEEFIRQAQSHLLEVARAYWALALARVVLIRNKALFGDFEAIVKQLEARGDEALKSQVARARAEVIKRRVSLLRAANAVANAQSRLQSLIGSPDILKADRELIPIDVPIGQEVKVDVRRAARVALANRSEVRQALLQIKASYLRTEQSVNELRPRLDLIAQLGLNGLQEDEQFGEALGDEFSTEPSWGAGLQFEMPLGNRTARARHQRRIFEERQLITQSKVSIDNVLLEVLITHRELETNYAEYQANVELLKAAREELAALKARRTIQELDPQKGQELTVFLEQIINAQNRVLDAETGMMRSLTTYNVSLLSLQRATGTLMSSRQLNAVLKGEGADRKMVIE